MTAPVRAPGPSPAGRMSSAPAGPATDPKDEGLTSVPGLTSRPGEPEPRVEGGWERPSPTRRQQRWDLLVGLLIGGGTVLSVVLARSAGMGFDDLRPSPGEEISWALAVGLPLCLRRRYPLLVLTACSIAFIGLQSRYVSESTMSSICLFVALYTAGAWGRNRRITAAVRVIVVVAMFSWLAYAISATAWASTDHLEAADQDGPFSAQTAAVIYTTGINVLFFAAAWAFGNAAWAQTKQRAELAERNRELKRERDANARRAVIAERVRIARELHDVVAHHVSVMGVQAGAARRVLDRDPALAERTLSSIEAAGRSAVEEMHRLLAVLREGEPADDGPSDRSPAPGLDQFEALIAHARGTLPGTSLTVVGEPRPVPPSISVSLYRITQEALTNTVRHAGASRIDVRLRYLDGAVEVEVVDDGSGTGERGAGGSGLGHVGMRERIALHDGHLELGPRPTGGFRVRARFPVS